MYFNLRKSNCCTPHFLNSCPSMRQTSDCWCLCLAHIISNFRSMTRHENQLFASCIKVASKWRSAWRTAGNNRQQQQFVVLQAVNDLFLRYFTSTKKCRHCWLLESYLSIKWLVLHVDYSSPPLYLECLVRLSYLFTINFRVWS